jgi:hypothetical protein
MFLLSVAVAVVHSTSVAVAVVAVPHSELLH